MGIAGRCEGVTATGWWVEWSTLSEELRMYKSTSRTPAPSRSHLTRPPARLGGPGKAMRIGEDIFMELVSRTREGREVEKSLLRRDGT